MLLGNFESTRKFRILLSLSNIISMDYVEEIVDFDTSTFVQLVFALIIPDISSFAVLFAPEFIHTIKIIENYFEEMSDCISSANFTHCTLIRKNINNNKFIDALNRGLHELAMEYGGKSYRLERAVFIREQCQQQAFHGILHRLWPTLIFASTTLGGSFSIYQQRIQYYCGENLPLINQAIYAASEGSLGTIASVHTDEYFLAVTSVFFEFIKEEDIHQVITITLNSYDFYSIFSIIYRILSIVLTDKRIEESVECSSHKM